MASQNMAIDFRARSRAWFCACRKCGGDFNHPPAVAERRHAAGKFAPPRLCSSCVLVAMLKFAFSDDETEPSE